MAAALPRLLAGLLGLLAANAQAITIDFSNAGGAGGGYGNVLTFSGGGLSLTARAYSETGAEAPAGSGFYRFQTAEIYGWGTGIGVCNRAEGLAHGGCDSSEHELDTIGRDDLLVLLFDRRVQFDSVTVAPYDGPGSDANDRDIMYWVGDLAGVPSLSTHTFDSLDSIAGMGGERLSAALSSYSPLTHRLTGTGNALFLAGNYRIRGCNAGNISGDSECEAYKIRGISVTLASAPSVVPVPPAAWMLGSALLALAGLRRHNFT